MRVVWVCCLSSFLTVSALAQPPRVEPEPVSPEATAAAADPATERASREAIQEALTQLTESGGLTSAQAVAQAVATAPSLEASAAAVAAAEAGARRAWQAFFPQLEISARYTRLSPIDQPQFAVSVISEEDAANFDTLIAGVDDPEARLLWQGLIGSFTDSEGFEFPVILNNYVLRGTATLPVSDLFLTILPSYRAAQAAVDVTESQTATQERQIALQARQAYYQLARARAAVLVAEKAVEEAEGSRTQMAALVAGGVRPNVDLLQLDARLAQIRVSLVRARSGARIAERALQVLLHDDAPIRIGEDFGADVPPPGGTVDQLTERALRDRTEMETLRRLVEARERTIRASLGRQYPQLFVQGNVDLANPNQRIIPQVAEFRTTWDVSVVLRWSPNEMGAARADAAEARALLEQARADMASLSDAVRFEVSDAHARMEAAREALRAAEVGLVAAQEQYEVRRAQLDAGAAVTLDVLQAETSLTRSRLEIVQAAVELRLARADLIRAIGN